MRCQAFRSDGAGGLGKKLFSKKGLPRSNWVGGLIEGLTNGERLTDRRARAPKVPVRLGTGSGRLLWGCHPGGRESVHRSIQPGLSCGNGSEFPSLTVEFASHASISISENAIMNPERSLQDQFAPELICFGCGPANEQGLRIKSFVRGEEVVARFDPAPHHRAFPGMINGGTIGALLDCHMNWTAAWHLMVRNELDKPPCTVTAEYSVQFQLPTPSDRPIDLVARVVDSSDRKAVVEAEVRVDRQVTATGRGTFVSVKPGHPAYHRW